MTTNERSGWHWMRWLMHVYWRFSRGMTLGVRGAVLNDAGEVFLVRHGYTPGWHLPGGGVEPGESLVDALAKELREEGRIALTGPAMLHGMFFNAAISQRDHVAVFVVREFRIEGPRLPDREIVEARFFPIRQLPEGTTGGTRRRLMEICDGAGISPFW